jgi:hypothetical protein
MEAGFLVVCITVWLLTCLNDTYRGIDTARRLPILKTLDIMKFFNIHKNAYRKEPYTLKRLMAGNAK